MFLCRPSPLSAASAVATTAAHTAILFCAVPYRAAPPTNGFSARSVSPPRRRRNRLPHGAARKRGMPARAETNRVSLCFVYWRGGCIFIDESAESDFAGLLRAPHRTAFSRTLFHPLVVFCAHPFAPVASPSQIQSLAHRGSEARKYKTQGTTL